MVGFLFGMVVMFGIFLAAGALRLRAKHKKYANDTAAMSETIVAVKRNDKGEVSRYAY